MYGWINGCLEDLITTNYGVDAWQQIRKDANVEGDFFRSSYYSDESTVKLISAGAKFLNQTAESLLEQFGAHFIHYLESYGYGRTMRCQGSTFREWIRNVNEPHRLLKSRFPDSSFPEFWLEDNAADLNGNSVILHYTSQRTGGLAPIVVGIVKEAASFYFGLAIEMVDFQDQQSPSAGKYHGRWTLVGLNNEPNKIPSVLAGEENTRRTSSKSPCVSPVKGTESRCPFHHYQSSEPSSPIPAHLPSKDDPSMFAAANDVGDDVGVNGHVLKRIFPFHIVVNQQMEVVQIGHKLRELVDMRWKLPKMLRTFIGDHFRITLPSHFEWNWDELRTLQRMTIEMVLTSQLVNREGKHVNLKFRGEVIFLDEGDNAVDMSEFDQDVIRTPRSNRKYLSGRPNNSSRAAFFINPDITNMDDLLSLHMKLTDLPRHGFQADLLLIDEHLKTETSYALKLTEISRNLDLESRKAKEALKMKRIFVRYVSHEIRTPLNIAILGLKCLEHELTERYPWILQEIADDAAANALIAEDDDDDEEVDEADIVNLRDNSVSMSNIMPSMGIASDAQSHSIHGTPGTSPRPSAHHRALSKLPPRPLSSLSSPHRLASIPNSVKPPPVCDGRQNSGKVIRAAENLFVNTSILSPNVQSVASFLENGKPAGEESLISTIMDEIKTSCTVAVDILNDLLLYEKIDNGIFDMAKHPTNLHDLLDESIKLFRVQAKGADVDFQMDDHQMVTEGQSCVYGFELASPLSTPSTDNHHRSNRHSHQAHTPTSGAHVPAQSIISALDRSKIQQVLRNLFTNAVKFTPPGGRVTLSYAIFGPDAPSLIPKTQKEGIGARQMMNTSLFYNCYSTVSNSASVSSVCLSSAPPSTSTSSLSSSTLLMPNLSLEQPSVAHAMVAAPTAPSAKDFPITFAEDVPNFSSHFARIAISDTGPGISSSDQCTLFHEFIQVKADKLQNGQGSGLGLWIAATIMKMHGGRIGVVSAGEGHGSTFLVDIPITPPPAPAQTSAVDKNSSIGGITPPFLLDPQGLQTTSSRHNSFAQEEYPTAENHLVSLVKESVRKGSMSGLNSPSPRNTTKASDPRCCSTDDEHIEYMDDEDDYSDTDSGKWDDFAHLLVKVEAQIERDDRMHSTPTAVAAAAVGQETTSVSNSGWQVGRDFLISLSPKERQRFLQHLQSMPSTAGMAAIVTRNASFRGRSGTNSVPASPSVRSGHEILRPLASSIVWRPRKTLREARVLIVDDAPTNRKMIRRLLHRHFDYLDEADNGLTAVNKFKEALPILPWKPTSEAAAILSQDSEEDVEREPSESRQGYDLILMDFMMPHMNGPDATLLIKQIAAEQHFPVIIIGVTGNGLPEDIQAFHNHGADEVMVKPLEFDRFMHYLQNHIHFAN